MKFMDRFRKQKISDDTPETEGEEVSPVGHAMSENDDVQRKQRLLLGGVALIALVGGAWWVLDSSVSEEELANSGICLFYTFDAADDLVRVHSQCLRVI